MNDAIERKFATVTPAFAWLRRGNDRRCRSQGRKPRKDSVLGGLPSEQRVKVDKWLFDKGLTYEQVAEACGKMLGVKVSRSSVGRYYQTRSKVQSPKSKVGERETEDVSGSVGGWASEKEEPRTVEENYERLLAKVRELAWLEANLPSELRDVRWFCQLMRILIAARRERNRAVLAEVARKKFELRAAKEVLKHLRYSIYDLRGKKQSATLYRARLRGFDARAQQCGQSRGSGHIGALEYSVVAAAGDGRTPSGAVPPDAPEAASS